MNIALVFPLGLYLPIHIYILAILICRLVDLSTCRPSVIVNSKDPVDQHLHLHFYTLLILILSTCGQPHIQWKLKGLSHSPSPQGVDCDHASGICIDDYYVLTVRITTLALFPIMHFAFVFPFGHYLHYHLYI